MLEPMIKYSTLWKIALTQSTFNENNFSVEFEVTPGK